jgi:hypothetical protein
VWSLLQELELAEMNVAFSARLSSGEDTCSP